MVDSFICDNCNEKLNEATKFKQNCIELYKKNNPSVGKSIKTAPTINNTTEENDKKEQFYIIEGNDQMLLNQNEDSNNQNNYIEMDQSAEEVEYSVYEIDEHPKQTGSTSISPILSPSKVIRTRQGKQLKNEDSGDSFTIINHVSPNKGQQSKLESSEDQKKSKAKTRKSYTLQTKLEIIDFAEKFTNREAARKYFLNESSIRCFRRQKDSLLKMNPDKSTNRKGRIRIDNDKKWGFFH